MNKDAITIEKIDQVFDRVPNTTYAKAKEALMETNGDVIEAIILLEGQKNPTKMDQMKKNVEDTIGKDGEVLKEQLKELLKKSSVIRIIIEKNNRRIMNIPLTVGVVGLALGPVVALVGLSTAVLGKYDIKVENEEDGTIVDLGELNEEKLNMLKQMLANTAKEVKDVVVDKNKDIKDEKDITDELIKEEDNKDI